MRNNLIAAGLDACLVGGAVRDQLLGKPAKDEDYLVAGISHAGLRAAIVPYVGTIEDLVVAGRNVGIRADGVEIVPPRREVSTGPGHTDFAIIADKSVSVAADLARRDFTCNAIAQSLATGAYVDPFGGIADIRAGILRTVSPQSFRDDPLRILRGLTRISKDGLAPTAATMAQMSAYAAGISNLSSERIQAELDKILMGDHVASALRIARDTGVLGAFLREFLPCIGFQQESKYHDLTLDEHIIQAIQAASDSGASLRVRLALLLHDCGKPSSAWTGKDGRLHYYANAALGKQDHAVIGARMAKAALTRLRYPVKMVRDVETLVGAHMLQPTNKPAKIRRLRAKFGDELLAELFAHRRADCAGKDGNADTCTLDRMENLHAQSRATGEATTLSQLAISGRDLTALGIHGRAVGSTLAALLEHVLGDPAQNRRDNLLRQATRQTS